MEQATPRGRSVTIELDGDSDPISGTVAGSADPPRQFSGWLELIAALQREATATTEEER